MSTLLKHSNFFIRSAFEIKQRHYVDDLDCSNYFEILVIKKSKNEYCLIFHNADNGGGFWIESKLKKENAEEIFKSEQNWNLHYYCSVTKCWDKTVNYKYPETPWFYSEDINFSENTFYPPFIKRSN